MSELLSISAENLDPARRIALAYAPARARPAWLALFMFQHKLAETARPGREPLMVQLRLSWWRDRLKENSDAWPVSEPVLSALKAWNGEHGRLVCLVDGCEASVLAAEDGHADCEEFASAQVAAYVALAEVLGVGDTGAVRTAAESLAGGPIGHRQARAVPRPMRPLAVLAAMQRSAERQGGARPVADMIAVIRAGLLGF